MLEKGVRLGFGLTGLGTAVLAAATPALVPSVFGEKWNDAIDVIPWCLLGFMLSGPIVASTGSYLAAIGHAGDVARAAALQAVVWFAIAFALLPTLGATAIGVGAAVAGIVEAVYLTRALKAHVDARVVQNALPAVMIAVGAAAIGWLTQAHLEPTLYGAAIAAMAAGCSYILALWVVRADSVREMWQLVRRVAVRG